jgi:hypothetical protein
LKAFENILGLQLGVGVLEADFDANVVELDAVVRNAGGLQGILGTSLGLGIHLDRDLGAGELHGRRFAEEVGQGIDEAQQQRDGDGDVLPEWVAIHGDSKTTKAAQGCLLG